MHEGHRKRMLQRLEHGEGLQDHELLEVLLFNAIPRKNTNPLAHELLTAFSSLGELFGASYEELLDVDGVGPETAAYLYRDPYGASLREEERPARPVQRGKVFGIPARALCGDEGRSHRSVFR